MPPDLFDNILQSVDEHQAAVNREENVVGDNGRLANRVSLELLKDRDCLGREAVKHVGRHERIIHPGAANPAAAGIGEEIAGEIGLVGPPGKRDGLRVFLGDELEAFIGQLQPPKKNLSKE